MAALFCIGLLLYYACAFRGVSGGDRPLAKLLWFLYFTLGCSSLVIELTGVLDPTFPPNYSAALFLLVCVLIGISGFLRFRSLSPGSLGFQFPGQSLVEAFLVVSQGYAIGFFMPFALNSLTGDPNENRLYLIDKMDVLGAYGVLNTVAGAASHLFCASLVLAAMRLSQDTHRRRNTLIAGVLTLSSLSYVLYVLAYVGRDGIVYWAMTALLVFCVFRPCLRRPLQRTILIAGASIGVLMLVPFIMITTARFADDSRGVVLSVLDYFGMQIFHFGDYSTIDRPMTYGVMNFPMLYGAICSLASAVECGTWEQVRGYVFDLYLAQGKAPWLFGTYVSDFVADFGYVGTCGMLIAFSALCHRICRGRDSSGKFTPERLLLVFLCFLVPYWGVFYFRFGIINSFIVVNVAFIGFVWALRRVLSSRGRILRGHRPT